MKKKVISIFMFLVCFRIYFIILKKIVNLLPMRPMTDILSLFFIIFVLIPLAYITSLKIIEICRNIDLKNRK